MADTSILSSLYYSNNANVFYPYYVDQFRYGILPVEYTFPENLTISSFPYGYALLKFLLSAGNLTQDCNLASSWYAHSQLGSNENASFGYGNETINIDFLRLAAPELVTKVTDSEIASLYNLMANSTTLENNVANGVLNITRPVIEYYCLSHQLAADVQLVPTNQDCDIQLQYWAYPGHESIDETMNVMAAYASLPAQYHNISIQTFWGWYKAQNVSTTAEIYTQKKDCYQSVCATLNSSGNPDIAGIGICQMFISYILEALLASFIIVQTCWHNWRYRKLGSNTTASADTLREDFAQATDTFLDNGIVFLLSLTVALLAVGSHETIVYNGLITQLACYFSASAILAVAAIPRRGFDQRPTLWVTLIICLLLLTFVSGKVGQYDTDLGAFSDERTDKLIFGIGTLGVELKYVQIINSIGATEFFNEFGVSIPPQPFTVSSCLIWGMFYTQPVLFGDEYLFATVFVEIFGYCLGILLFILLTKIIWWRYYQQRAMGSYYTEETVGYGQVLSLFLWTSVFIAFVQIITKKIPKSWYSRIPTIPFWHSRKKASAQGIQLQQLAPLIATVTPASPTTAGIHSALPGNASNPPSTAPTSNSMANFHPTAMTLNNVVDPFPTTSTTNNQASDPSRAQRRTNTR
ncbi:uncharacterized protein BCR38DRAFT_493513 [Pseudomassariella vexata]|uniref:Uncharacterized protein n=1 Tax=Pseudomassariella vexata TaxID=1141098 RepID=A0A1Y2EJT5_9PEZI|nr:uncharacterized protein BCR38DRAFT_493513 [Pseudomassariella vexata]ORY71819.1 hypothetical protein BCR38DRAFT_493513 [Pseudomassariella vexata]